MSHMVLKCLLVRWTFPLFLFLFLPDFFFT